MTTKNKFVYDYPRGATTVDCVVFGVDLKEELLNVVLIRRGDEPFKGRWALPGGFLNVDEDIEVGAMRELKEETGLVISYLEQLYTFGDVGRDPRERVISVAHFALVRSDELTPVGGDDAVEAKWFDVLTVHKRELAFDHTEIVNKALKRLKAKIRYEPIGFDMMPKRFTISELRSLYEIILGRKLDNRNFRKQILKMGILVENGTRTGVAGPAPTLFSFDKNGYDMAVRDGFNFDI